MLTPTSPLVMCFVLAAAVTLPAASEGIRQEVIAATAHDERRE